MTPEDWKLVMPEERLFDERFFALTGYHPSITRSDGSGASSSASRRAKGARSDGTSIWPNWASAR